MHRKRKFLMGFTLIELLVAIIIIGILAAIGIPTYQNIIADQKSRACQSHLSLLNMSLKLYTLDNNALPASLSGVWPKYTGMALAQREKEKRKSKFYCFVSSLKKLGVPFAEALTPDSLPPSYYDNNISILACPADKTKPTANYDAQGKIVSISGVSYGLNKDLAGLSSEELSLLPDVISIVDSEKEKADLTNPGDIEYRHQTGFWRRKNFANAITLGTMPVSITQGGYGHALAEVSGIGIHTSMSDTHLKAANNQWKELANRMEEYFDYPSYP